MNQLTINDNSEKSKTEFEQNIPTITKKIADKTLEQLEQEGIFVFPEIVSKTGDLSADQMILQGINKFYRTANVMGFLGSGSERLTIQSRFSKNNNDFLLQYLLKEVLEYPNVFDLEIDADPNKRVLDLLTFLFPRCLHNAMRKGLFKMYLRVEYNDSNPKGSINIARHIKKNVPFVGKIAYSQRENVCDNYLIELIRHTIEFIKLKPYGKAILDNVKAEVDQIIEATPKYQLHNRQKILTENKKHTVRHAYYYEYSYLQNMCIAILQNQKHGIGTEGKQMYGVLFDGAWLWEEYVNKLVREYFYHPQNKIRVGAHHLFQGNNGRIYPDFIGKNCESRIIADAKYKPIKNINGSDYFQVLAYMLRFGAKKGFYFYPESEETKDCLELKLQSGSLYDKNATVLKNEDISVFKLGLVIPREEKSYNEFCKKMKYAEKNFIDSFKNLIRES